MYHFKDLFIMKEFSFTRFLFFPAILLILLSCTQKQPEEPDPVRRKSPIAITRINHGDTYIKIVYGQPYMNGRKIFGDLVPYGEVWRTGANEATEITTTQPILFGSKHLDPGTYSLFTIPGEASWTIILNKELGQWGAFEYNSEADLFRVDMPVMMTEKPIQVFTIQFNEITDDSTSISMKWSRTQVDIPIEFLNSATNS